MKKNLSVVLFIAIMVTMIAIPFSGSADETNNRQVAIDFVIQSYQQMGMQLTTSDIELLESQIDSSANKLCELYDVPLDDGYDLLLEEMSAHVATDTTLASGIQPYSGGSGTVPLPSSQAGDIYYVDLANPTFNLLNHVGIYVAAQTVVDAAITHGVRYFSITDSRVYQKPDGSKEDSAILRLRNAGNTPGYAVAWVINNIADNSPYDTDFWDNKSDTYQINQGSADNPIWVTYYESDAYNCAELVWKAYRNASGVDLDSDGGLGVYPDDIRNATQLYVINDTWDD